MAMLAGSRRKKTYQLVPKGKPLYDDESRYGAKMLKKMGWSMGKGLGKKEDGAVDFIRIRYKNDSDGVGYVDRDDQWTQHEEKFTGLLNSLQGDNKDDGKEREKALNADAEQTDELMATIGFGYESAKKSKKKKAKKLKEELSGESLEQKSKQSRARVHYKKYTRGKDLANYREKDLANIFGKKEERKNEDDDIWEKLEFIDNNLEQLEEAKTEPELNYPTLLKINKKMKKKSNKLHEEETLDQQQSYSVENDEGKDKDKKTSERLSKKKKSKKFNASTPDDILEENVINEGEENVKEKTKKKKKEKLCDNSEDFARNPAKMSDKVTFPSDHMEKTGPERKAKNDQQIDIDGAAEIAETRSHKVKKKISKKEQLLDSHEMYENEGSLKGDDDCMTTQETQNKKKKRKRTRDPEMSNNWEEAAIENKSDEDLTMDAVKPNKSVPAAEDNESIFDHSANNSKKIKKSKKITESSCSCSKRKNWISRRKTIN